MPLEKALDSAVVGGIAMLAFDDTHNLAEVDGRIELFEIEDGGGDGLGKVVGGTPGMLCTPIGEGKHSSSDKAAGLVADLGWSDAGLLAACGDCFSEQHNGANDLIVVLNRIDEVQFDLGEVVRSGHRTCAPQAASMVR